ncbi:MAG: ribulose-phosphate 3-epimerase [Candidatus Melainabacteria bacterium GWA2_34_9]|nr:MAG: ribulose-phosphate 3-epimerase [Candidatus Melainabacteria bacterium GWA2_34_9]
MKNIIVAPSILSADFANLERDIKKIEHAGADWVHVDVMDGRFVPNITIGAPVVKSIRKITKMPFDVHLMIIEPIKYVEDFAKAGSDFITIHAEACENNLEETIDLIKSFRIKAGVSIKPKTSVDVIKKILHKIDLVLIMTVEPGFGGQSFIMDCLPKISEVKKLIEKENLGHIYIEVDGGINAETAKLATSAGANALVAGNYVYNAKDMPKAIEALR